MFGDNTNLDHLENCECEGSAPEDTSGGLDSRNVDHRFIRAVLQHSDDQTDKEEGVSDDVVSIPESEVSLLEPSPVGIGSLEVPEEEGSPNVPETVRGDEDGKESVHPVYVRILRLSDLDDDETDEADVGEGGVDGPVERNPPFLAEPGGRRSLATL